MRRRAELTVEDMLIAVGMAAAAFLTLIGAFLLWRAFGVDTFLSPWSMLGLSIVGVVFTPRTPLTHENARAGQRVHSAIFGEGEVGHRDGRAFVLYPRSPGELTSDIYGCEIDPPLRPMDESARQRWDALYSHLPTQQREGVHVGATGVWYPQATGTHTFGGRLRSDVRAQQEQRASEAPKAWNTCPGCDQLVDADDVHDGSEVRCLGCQRWLVVVELCTDPPMWRLDPVTSPAEEDSGPCSCGSYGEGHVGTKETHIAGEHPHCAFSKAFA